MLKIMTVNVNGIRSAARKGFYDWLKIQNADVICLQELRAQEADLTEQVLAMEGYHAFFHFAAKKGYSGVGIYTRYRPNAVKKGLGWEVADTEGRYVAVQLNNLWIASLYMPSGTSGDTRQAVKFDFLKQFEVYLQKLKETHHPYIICGDWNIAHQAIDLKNWRSNQKNSGFLPEERAWMDRLFSDLGFVDAFRVVNQAPEQYTWWSNRGKAWDNNVGWRIDYQIISPELKSLVKNVQIYKDQRFSDHAPLTIDYEIKIT